MRARLHKLATPAFTAAFMSFRLLAHQKAGDGVNQRIITHSRQRLDQ